MEDYYDSSQKLRILIVTHRYLKYSLGGTELLAHDVARHLALRGHIVYWLSTHDNETGFNFTKMTSGVVIFEIPAFFDQSYPSRWSAQENKVSNIIARGLKEYNIQQFDIIHFFHIARIGLNFIKLPFFQNSRIVFTATDYTLICPDFQLYNFKKQEICNVNANYKECALCINQNKHEEDIASWRERNIQFAKHQVEAFYFQTPYQSYMFQQAGIDSLKINSQQAVYTLPPYNKYLLKFQKPKLPFRFCYFGRISFEKGLHIILSIFKEIYQQHGATFAIYGKIEESFKNLESLNNNDSGVSFHGMIPINKVVIELVKYDALLIPSLWLENHPTILTFAHSLGLTVICSETLSLKHLQGIKGIYFAESNNSQAWSQMMKSILQIPASSRAAKPYFKTLNPLFRNFIDKLENNYYSLVRNVSLGNRK